MDVVDFEVSTYNILLENAADLNVDTVAKAGKVHVPASQCFQTLEDFNANVNNLSGETWCSGAIETESDDNIFATCNLNLSVTPPRPCNSIVEQVMRDFCSSPLSPSSVALEERIKLQQLYRSPCFRFTHKNVRVYGNKKARKLFTSKRTEEEEEQHFPIVEDDDCLSISSGLSVQEDLTQPEIECEENNRCALNQSQNIYENLLNLSAYFTQRTGDNILNKGDIKKIDIETNIDIVEDTRDTQQIEYSDKDQQSMEVSNVRGWLSEAESDSMSDTPVSESSIKPANGQNKEKTVVENSKVVAEEGPLFSDDECDEFFMNFNSQDVLDSTVKAVDTKTKLPNKNIIKQQKQLASGEERNAKVSTAAVQNFNGFQTAGNKPIKISDAAKNRASKLIADVIELKSNENELLEMEKEVFNMSPQNLNDNELKFGGFQTAGNKPIKISEKSKSKVSKLIADVIDLKLDENQVLLKEPKEKIPNDFGFGFQTAGRKPIKISEKSKNDASKLLADAMELEHAGNQLLEFKHSDYGVSSVISQNRAAKDQPFELSDENEGEFKGFSPNPEPINTLAKQTKISNENMQNEALQEYGDIQFSEWPPATEMTTSQPKEEELPLPMLDITDSKSTTITDNTERNSSNVSKDGNIKLIARRNLLSLSNRRKLTKPKGNVSSKSNINDKQGLCLTPKNKVLNKNIPDMPTIHSTPSGAKEPSIDLPITSTPSAFDTATSDKSNRKGKTPTASERIDYLSRYGELPDLSPIPNITPKGIDITRPCGLRRIIRKLK